MHWFSLFVCSSSREQIEFWYFFSFCPQKGRDFDQPISRHLYAAKILSFYDVSRARKILITFDQVLWSKGFEIEKSESITGFSKFSSLIFLGILSIPIPKGEQIDFNSRTQYEITWNRMKSLEIKEITKLVWSSLFLSLIITAHHRLISDNQRRLSTQSIISKIQPHHLSLTIGKNRLVATDWPVFQPIRFQEGFFFDNHRIL